MLLLLRMIKNLSQECHKSLKWSGKLSVCILEYQKILWYRVTVKMTSQSGGQDIIQVRLKRKWSYLLPERHYEQQQQQHMGILIEFF